MRNNSVDESGKEGRRLCRKRRWTQFYRSNLGGVLAGGMDEKEAPCIGGIEDGRADTLAVPSVPLPAWLNLQNRQAGVVAGIHGQGTTMVVELFGQIAQAKPVRGDVFHDGGGKEAAIGNMDGDILERHARMVPLLGSVRPVIARYPGFCHRCDVAAGQAQGHPLEPAQQPLHGAGDFGKRSGEGGEVHSVGSVHGPLGREARR